MPAASFFATAGATISGQMFREGDTSPEETNRQFLQAVFSGLGPAGDRNASPSAPARRPRCAPRRL